MLDFIKVSLPLFKGDCTLAFRNSVELVIIDGLCLGIDVAGEKQKREIMRECHEFLCKLEQYIFNTNRIS